MTTTKQPLKKSNQIVINFSSPADNTTARMQVSNSLFYDNLDELKVVLSYLELDNTAVPILVPKKLNVLPSLPSGYTFDGATISNISIDYTVGVNIGVNTKLKIPQFIPLNPALTPPPVLLNEKQVYQTPYFYVYDITHFLAIISDAYQTLVPGAAVFDFVYDQSSNNIRLYIDKTAYNPLTDAIHVNDELNRLLAFKSIPSGTANINNLIHDGEQSYNSTDCYFFESRFISRQWVSFDTILVETDLPLRSVEYQNNQSSLTQASTTYKNVIFSLNTVESSINFYPYYVFTTDSTDKFLSFAQNKFNENFYNIDLILFNKRLNLGIPYKLNRGELFNLTLLVFKE